MRKRIQQLARGKFEYAKPLLRFSTDKIEIEVLEGKDYTGDFIVIGDRFHDIETATKNGLKSIGCGYGYGSLEELSAADIIVNSPKEIPNAVEKLIG